MTILRCKVAIVGDSKVGKTTLTKVFHKGNEFGKNYVMTLGSELAVKTVNIPESDFSVELYLIDTAGSPIYKDVRSKYWMGSNFLMLCYDVSNRASFTNLKKWVEEAKKCMSKPSSTSSSTSAAKKRPVGILVACKNDLNEFAATKTDEAQEFAAEHALAFFECSALTGKDVDAPFNFLASVFHQLYEEKVKNVLESID